MNVRDLNERQRRYLDLIIMRASGRPVSLRDFQEAFMVLSPDERRDVGLLLIVLVFVLVALHQQ